ncbi:MAG: PEP-CTERM sorting domain-containing protein [Burkholderiales bacterium]|jgi:hypothetical protein|nr:PEP-CTERM sorting domain-containing protein [Burkholderiales bacterium]
MNVIAMARRVGARCIVIALLGGVLPWSGAAHAIAIAGTDATETLTDTIAACDGIDGKAYADCTNTARYSTTSLKGDNASFRKAFDAWNGRNTAGGQWNLKDGGALPGGKFEISTFDADARATVGELIIQIDWAYDGADKGDFKWAQALQANFTVSPRAAVPAYFDMDVGAAAGCDDATLLKQCPPLYPFQYADRKFYDGPRAPWPDGLFDGWTFLSKVDRTTRTLTIYEGVEYGFKLSARLVPEPGTWVMVLVLGSAAAWRSRHRPGALST